MLRARRAVDGRDWGCDSNGLAAHCDVLCQDVRYASCSIRRAPGFAATVVLVAALGIGATTAVFTVADYVLVRPLPYLHSERLVRMWEARPGYLQMELSPPNYLDEGGGDVVRSDGGVCSVVYFDGRARRTDSGGRRQPRGGFATYARHCACHGPMVYCRRGTQRRTRSRDPWLRIVGVSIRRSDGRDRRKDLLDGDPHTIIGIMPPEFSFPQRRAQVWRPLRFRPADLANRSNNYLSAIARRKPGVSLEQARQEMRLISARLATQYPKENSALSATVASLRDQVSLQSRTLVMALLAASACVLLIACTNLANLLLARALSRQKELAVRVSLGAGRERLARQPLRRAFAGRTRRSARYCRRECRPAAAGHTGSDFASDGESEHRRTSPAVRGRDHGGNRAGVRSTSVAARLPGRGLACARARARAWEEGKRDCARRW